MAIQNVENEGETIKKLSEKINNVSTTGSIRLSMDGEQVNVTIADPIPIAPYLVQERKFVIPKDDIKSILQHLYME